LFAPPFRKPASARFLIQNSSAKTADLNQDLNLFLSIHFFMVNRVIIYRGETMNVKAKSLFIHALTKLFERILLSRGSSGVVDYESPRA
jgi:hypothetical protein